MKVDIMSVVSSMKTARTIKDIQKACDIVKYMSHFYHFKSPVSTDHVPSKLAIRENLQPNPQNSGQPRECLTLTPCLTAPCFGVHFVLLDLTERFASQYVACIFHFLHLPYVSCSSLVKA